MLLADACVCMLGWHAHIVWMCAHSWNNYVAYNCSTHVRTLSKFWEADLLFHLFFFFFFFFWCSSGFVFCWICLSMRFCLFIHFFSMLLLSFLQLHTKIQASHNLVNIMEEVQFVSYKIEKAFEQCSCMWSDVGGTQHETIYLLIMKCIYFMNSYLECTVLVFFLIKSENSLIHGLFHNCSFMHKLLVILCTGTCPVSAVNMSVHLMTAFPLKLSVTNSWTACRFLAWIYYEQ